jgi:inosine-uridine nucleoside N-ribohydrolase
VIDHSLVRRRPFHIEVETAAGPSQGSTIADRRPIKGGWKKPPNLQVCVEVDSRRFVDLYLERVCRQLS